MKNLYCKGYGCSVGIDGLCFADRYSGEQLKQVEEYLTGERREFCVDTNQDGTEFQKAVWGEMTKIPYGETRSYKEIAVAIGKPMAVRAVGAACGKNKLPIIVPCHRVVGSNGLGGFAFDVELKCRLLNLEARNLK